MIGILRCHQNYMRGVCQLAVVILSRCCIYVKDNLLIECYQESLPPQKDVQVYFRIIINYM